MRGNVWLVNNRLNKAVREGVITSTASLNKCVVILSSPKDLLGFRWQIVSDSKLPGTGSKQGRIQDFKRGGGWQTIFIEGW